MWQPSWGHHQEAHAMTDATQPSYNCKRVKIVVLLLSIGGAIAALLGVTSLVLGRSRLMVGLPLLFGGLGIVAFAQLFGLLTEIATHLAAIRAQMGSQFRVQS
jgi:hypothetical protein